MNLPAAVIAAMALCNQHVVASKTANGIGLSGYSGVSTTFIACGVGWNCTTEQKETDAQRKEREDSRTASNFSEAYAWEPPYQTKCKKIQDYVSDFKASLDKKAADKKAAEDAAAKAAEQPTLDEGIAALPAIKSMQKK